MNALSVAKLGIGFGARAAVTLGLVSSLVVVPPQVAEARTVQGSGGGGSRSDAGTGWVRTEHGWVKLTKIQRVGVQALPYSTISRAHATIGHTGTSAGAASVDVRVFSQISTPAGKKSQAHTLDAHTTSHRTVTAHAAHLQAGATSADIEWLDADELAMIYFALDGNL
jgi:hypothetical protein